MNFRTKQYLRKRFGDYYQNSRLTLPPELARREWGFIFFDEMPEVVMRRHKAFSGEVETFEYLRSMVPAHVYHSAAYYQFPGAATMKEKQWQGADLIFDLDADHLPPEVRGKSYKEMLDSVKKETGKLLDFLLEDFGFSEDNVSIVFSGGRGYHIHVRDPKVLALGSPERREIVDYLNGTGLRTEFMFKEYGIGDSYETDLGKGTVYSQRIKVKPSTKRIISFENTPGGFGWGKRISEYIVSHLRELSSKDEHITLGETAYAIYLYYMQSDASNKNLKDIACKIFDLKMKHPSWTSKRISQEVNEYESFVHEIFSYRSKARKIINIAKNENAIIQIRDKGIIDFGGVPEFFEIILQGTKEKFGVQMGAKTDEPVTADVKRLIRMPSSLHGGSGMRVVPLTLSGLEKFEPLNDAVVFSEKEIKVEIIPPLKPQNSKVEMKGKSFTVTEGINTLPEYAAIYLMCRGAAEYA